MDTIDFLRRHSAARQTWEVIFDQDPHLESSLYMQFAQACALFNIEWRGPFHLALWDQISFSFLTMCKADVKRVLQMLAAHKMYSVAMLSKKKDVFPAIGFFDKQATMSSFNWLQRKYPDRFRLQHLQSMLVGCAPTADRTFAAGTAVSSDCRFCHCAKEDLHHLAFNCPSLPSSLERLDDDPQCGPNFTSLGLVEVTWKAVYDRLQISSITDILVEPWDPPQIRRAHYWTDGSVALARNFWKTRASYAVIDEWGHVVASGKVYHWCLSSYTAGLYASIVAFAAPEGPCIIHTDSLTIVQHFQRLPQCDELPFSLQLRLRAWWVFLFDLIASRQPNDEPILLLVWCPAHSWDHLPLECVTDEMLAAKSLSRENLCFNRKADLVAKEHLDAYNAAAQQTFQLERCSIQRQHLWLANLHLYLSEDLSNRISASAIGDSPAQDDGDQDILDVKELYPRWAWDADIASYPEPSPARDDDFSNYKGPINKENWKKVTSWMASLHWRIDPSCDTSFLELAAQAFCDGLHLTPVQDDAECLASTVSILRTITSAAVKRGHTLVPGNIDASASKCNGHRHPNGVIKGAAVLLSNKALRILANGFQRGGNTKLASWKPLTTSLL